MTSKQNIMELNSSHPQHYSFYNPSGVEWLGSVPTHWQVRQLRTVADMRVSDVD